MLSNRTAPLSAAVTVLVLSIAIFSACGSKAPAPIPLPSSQPGKVNTEIPLQPPAGQPEATPTSSAATGTGTGVAIPKTPWRIHVLELGDIIEPSVKAKLDAPAKDGWKRVPIRIGIENTSKDWGVLSLADGGSDDVKVVDSQGFDHRIVTDIYERNPRFIPPSTIVAQVIVAEIPQAYEEVSLKITGMFSLAPAAYPPALYAKHSTIAIGHELLATPVLVDLSNVEALPLPFNQPPQHVLAQIGDVITRERNLTVKISDLHQTDSGVSGVFEITNLGGKDMYPEVTVTGAVIDENGTYWWSPELIQFPNPNLNTFFAKSLAPGVTISGSTPLANGDLSGKKLWAVLGIDTSQGNWVSPGSPELRLVEVTK